MGSMYTFWESLIRGFALFPWESLFCIFLEALISLDFPASIPRTSTFSTIPVKSYPIS